MRLEDYKKNQIKEIELPSGLKVEIKTLNPYALLKIEEELGVDITNERAYSAKLIEKLFEMFLVKPKVPDEIKLSEFTKDDYMKLHEMVFEDVTFPTE